MAHSYSCNIQHVVFSTKYREQLILPDIKPVVLSAIGRTLNHLECQSLILNSMPDHVHLLFMLNRRRSIAEVVKEVKRNSSIWIKKEFPQTPFYWQEGYADFAVSYSNRSIVEKYIANQEAAHAKRTFQYELIGLLEKHNISYEESDLWN